MPNLIDFVLELVQLIDVPGGGCDVVLRSPGGNLLLRPVFSQSLEDASNTAQETRRLLLEILQRHTRGIALSLLEAGEQTAFKRCLELDDLWEEPPEGLEIDAVQIRNFRIEGARIERQLGHVPSDAELAAWLGLSPETVRRLRTAPNEE